MSNCAIQQPCLHMLSETEARDAEAFDSTPLMSHFEEQRAQNIHEIDAMLKSLTVALEHAPTLIVPTPGDPEFVEAVVYPAEHRLYGCIDYYKYRSEKTPGVNTFTRKYADTHKKRHCVEQYVNNRRTARTYVLPHAKHGHIDHYERGSLAVRWRTYEDDHKYHGEILYFPVNKSELARREHAPGRPAHGEIDFLDRKTMMTVRREYATGHPHQNKVDHFDIEEGFVHRMHNEDFMVDVFDMRGTLARRYYKKGHRNRGTVDYFKNDNLVRRVKDSGQVLLYDTDGEHRMTCYTDKHIHYRVLEELNPDKDEVFRRTYAPGHPKCGVIEYCDHIEYAPGHPEHGRLKFHRNAGDTVLEDFDRVEQPNCPFARNLVDDELDRFEHTPSHPCANLVILLDEFAPDGSITEWRIKPQQGHPSYGTIYFYAGNGDAFIKKLDTKKLDANLVQDLAEECVEMQYEPWRAAELELLLEEEMATKKKKKKKKNSKGNPRQKHAPVQTSAPAASASPQIPDIAESIPVVALDDRLTVGEEPPEDLVCPITHEVFEHPYTTEDGFTFEKSAIEKWFATHTTSPLTGNIISQAIIPCFALRNMCALWKATHSI